MSQAARAILVVDDDRDMLSLLDDLLTSEGYKVVKAKSGAEALAAISKSRPDLVMIDVLLPDEDGLTLLTQMKREHPELEVATLSRVFEKADMAKEVSALRLELGKQSAQRERIVGSSRPMLEIYKLIGKVAGSDASVLVSGESGTGKELVAEAIHRASPRNPHPLIKVSCAALPETLLETELFGHEKGSFTGAMTMRKGRFEIADKGTIFLDEIGEMTLGTQTKLLRILQEHEFERIGSNTPIKVDIRVIAATNRDLAEEVDRNRFREDLYYRLNVIHIHMPPLRDRKEDIPALVEHFLAKYRWSADAIPTTITEEALERLVAYDWPGNVRELENAIERAVVLSRGQPITVDQLPFDSQKAPRGNGRKPAASRAGEAEDAGDGLEPVAAGGKRTDASGNGAATDNGEGTGPFKKRVSALERRLILEALERAGGNRTRAAEELGIYRRLLYAKMREYGLGE
ncbi:MAG: sigma-54-dependent Fis family transcriptional regulator [Chloroflexi bacterium]|nr:MAG: sigma-54-dependent Fis family transcriptional regulator [Chloroflexota bacterium]